jgi:hypothetical protein
MADAAEVLDVLLDAIADRVVAKLRADGANVPVAPDGSPTKRRRPVRAPAQPDRPVTDIDRARAKKAMEGMGIR